MTSASSIVPAISTLSGAKTALATVKAAIGQLARDLGIVGATLSRLSYTKQLSVAENNLSAASSGITDMEIAGRVATTPATTSWCSAARRCWLRPTACPNQSCAFSFNTVIVALQALAGNHVEHLFVIGVVMHWVDRPNAG